VFVQGTTNSAGLLVTQVSWLVLFTLVELSQVVLLSLVDDGQDTSDRFADITAKLKNI